MGGIAIPVGQKRCLYGHGFYTSKELIFLEHLAASKAFNTSQQTPVCPVTHLFPPFQPKGARALSGTQDQLFPGQFYHC